MKSELAPTAPSPQGRAQWVAEQIFEWADFAGVHLRIGAFFMENVLLSPRPVIYEEDTSVSVPENTEVFCRRSVGRFSRRERSAHI